MNKKKIFIKIAVFVFWILIWQVLASAVDLEILVPSPSSVFSVLANLVATVEFWQSIAFSLIRIVIGFLIAVILGIVLAIITGFVPYAYDILSPVLNIIKASPVASFIILLFLWFKSTYIPIITSFIMVLPMVWSNVYQSIRNIDPKILEMGKMFGFSRAKMLEFIYLPECRKNFSSMLMVGVGFAWKAGIAAEVICNPSLSIGSNIYKSKIYLETPELFAWTIVVIILSITVENILKIMVYGREVEGNK